jgi:hypothetical protein
MIPPPIALGLTVCEQVIVDYRTRNVSLINRFTRFVATEFPFTPLPYCIYAVLTGGQGEAEITLTLTNVRTDEEVASILRRMTFADRFAEVQVLFRFTTIAFPEPGENLFTLMVDDDWITHCRIRVGE